jgi:hypothetical protein
MGMSYRGLFVYGLALQMKAVRSSETSGKALPAHTVCNIPEGVIFNKTTVITLNLTGYNRFPSTQSLLQYNNDMVQHVIPFYNLT